MATSSASASNMCLFMLKTHDLTTQDHSMNIESMLAPEQNYLKLKRHKTLNANCDAAKKMIDKEANHAQNSHRSEAKMVNRKKEELYVKRVNRLLDKMTEEERETILKRKSSSKCLNNIQEDRLPVYIVNAKMNTEKLTGSTESLASHHEQDFRTRSNSILQENEIVHHQRSRNNSIISSDYR